MFGHWLSEPCEQVQRGEGLNDGMAKTLHVLRMVMCAHMATARPAQTQPVPRSSACILLEIFGQCQPYAECSRSACTEYCKTELLNLRASEP